ncbi:TetR/AcrR family transcriptional regulator [bacterium]|nr:MAG: TetR/AcrR family transcriptional regulator [bacterium]
MAAKSDTKEKLLDATLELISEKGYLGASTREIAARAGVSELTLFRKFGKKESLFEEMLKTHTFLPRLRELLESVKDLPCEIVLETVGIKFLETLKERKQLVKIMITEINSYPDKIRETYAQFIANTGDELKSFLKKLHSEGRLRQVDLDIAAMMFFRVLFNFFQVEEILKEREVPPEEAEETVRHCVDLFLRGILIDRQESDVSSQ